MNLAREQSGERADLAAVAAAALGGRPDDPAVGVDLGWFGIGVAEEHGGFGSIDDLAVVIEAAGAAAAASAAPWTAGVVAPLLGADPLVAALLEGAPVALGTGSALTDDTADSGRVLGLGGGPGVPVAVASVVDGQECVTVYDGAAATEVAPMDPSRTLGAYPLPRIAVTSTAATHLEWAARVGLFAALDAAGCARTALARTVAYATERHQFGRPIGSFQAYKHRCADMFVELELAQSLAFRAAGALAAGDPAPALAAAITGPASAVAVCGQAIQLHGGIGFTWEAGLHVLLKRARVDQLIGDCGGLTTSLWLASRR